VIEVGGRRTAKTAELEAKSKFIVNCCSKEGQQQFREVGRQTQLARDRTRSRSNRQSGVAPIRKSVY
jgi:hypothetical protein